MCVLIHDTLKRIQVCRMKRIQVGRVGRIRKSANSMWPQKLRVVSHPGNVIQQTPMSQQKRFENVSRESKRKSVVQNLTNITNRIGSISSRLVLV
jgi:hypothetical protein